MNFHKYDEIVMRLFSFGMGLAVVITALSLSLKLAYMLYKGTL